MIVVQSVPQNKKDTIVSFHQQYQIVSRCLISKESKLQQSFDINKRETYIFLPEIFLNNFCGQTVLPSYNILQGCIFKHRCHPAHLPINLSHQVVSSSDIPTVSPKCTVLQYLSKTMLQVIGKSREIHKGGRD
jgi:hypothetical protein